MIEKLDRALYHSFPSGAQDNLHLPIDQFLKEFHNQENHLQLDFEAHYENDGCVTVEQESEFKQ